MVTNFAKAKGDNPGIPAGKSNHPQFRETSYLPTIAADVHQIGFVFKSCRE